MATDSNVRDLTITGISTSFADRSSSQAVSASNGSSFNPRCPECIRELWGPLLSPFAHLIKQKAEQLNAVLKRFGKSKLKRKRKPARRRPPKPPQLHYDDHHFLSTIGLLGFHVAKVGWLIAWTVGFFLLIVAILLLVLKYQSIPPILALLRMSDASDWGMKFTLQPVFIVTSVIGIWKMFASVLGLLGTSYRMGLLLFGTSIITVVLILLEIGVTIYCVISWSSLVSGIETALGNSFQSSYGKTDADQVTNSWDRIFQNFRCCGWLGNDFSTTPWQTVASSDVPYSCCRPSAPYPACGSSTAPPDQSYVATACRVAVRKQSSSNGYLLIASISTLLIVLMQIVCTLMTCLYALSLSSARSSRRRQNNRLMSKFQRQFRAYSETVSGEKEVPVDLAQPAVPHYDQPDIDELRRLYNQYSAFAQNPPEIDPSQVSALPKVEQVNRPDVYTYFYYE